MQPSTDYQALRDFLTRLVKTPKLAYSVPEAVVATSIGKTVLWEDIAKGKLPTRKRGTRTIILAEDLAAYLAGLPVLEPTIGRE